MTVPCLCGYSLPRGEIFGTDTQSVSGSRHALRSVCETE